MQSDPPTPSEQTPDGAPLQPSNPIVRGRTTIVPLSSNITLDPRPDIPTAPVADTFQATQPRNTTAEPDYHYLENVPTSDSVEERSLKEIRRQNIVSIIIIIIGLLTVGSAAFNIYGLIAQSSPGYFYVLYVIQGIFGLGLMARKEVFRWLILIFTVFDLIFTIYTIFISSLALSILLSNSALFGVAFLTVASKLIVPIALIIILNIKSVKNSFN